MTQSLFHDLSTVPKLISQNQSEILFHTFYVIAIFLDKIIVWVSYGLKSGTGMMIIGPYTVGAFLGLIPVFGITILVYFSEKTKTLVENVYKGTLIDIQRTTEKYKSIYRRSLQAMLLIALTLSILSNALCFYLINDLLVLRISITISLGALFFIVIVYNSVVLPLFRKTNISAISMFIVCAVEALAVLFVVHDIWYAAAGFLVGSFVGFLISSFATRQLFSEFEYNLFRPLSVAA